MLACPNFRYFIYTIIGKGHPYYPFPMFLLQLIRWELPIFLTSQVMVWGQAKLIFSAFYFSFPPQRSNLID